ncbi:MAG: CinA family protein [Betaproteobacteria bacterium]|nr:CinA family protein [Betaproteobacteria bacterium]
MDVTQETLEALAQDLGAALMQKGWMLACAESCTGGWAAQACTAVAGSSAWFERGFVTYSNAAKQEMLGVRGETLDAHGAVSEATAREMALGALAHSAAQAAFAITGIAGPTGGTAEKPVGTVWFAWAAGQGCRVEKRFFSGDRRAIRAQAAAHVLSTMREIIRATF